MRLLHLSDIHLWAWPTGPCQFLGKRLIAAAELAFGRAARFRLERLADVVTHAQSLDPDHILISGDFTTSALPSEFDAARDALAPLLADPARATVIPGNHDRYTRRATRAREFERHFADFLPAPDFPWTRPLGDRLTLLGLDPCRPHLTATGRLPPGQLARARALLAEMPDNARPIIACHYPLDAPEPYQETLHRKRLTNAATVAEWLRTVGPHLYCCGHVHAAWAFRPPSIPDQLCLNAGAPLLRDPHRRHRPGFLAIELEGQGVRVTHHGWSETDGWIADPLADEPNFWTSAS